MTASAQTETWRDKNGCDERKMWSISGGLLTTIPLEELFSHPTCYEDKIIRTYGIMRYGPEMVELFCLDCQIANVTWGEYENIYERCSTSKVKKAIESAAKPERGSNIGIVAIGKFSNKGGYGHMSSYKYQFTIICIDEVSQLVKSGIIPQAMNKDDRKRLYDWYEKTAKRKL